MNEKYFTERIFWLPDTNTLLHVRFAYGRWYGAGWYSSTEDCFIGYVEPTYAQLMLHYAHRSPELLLQED